MSAQAKSRAASTKSVEASLARLSTSVDRARTRRAGSILLRLSGENGGDFYVHTTNAGSTLSREPAAGSPHIEVIGDANRIRAILDGTKEGRAQFFAGGIRVRGDLQYLSDLAYELGFIKEPF
jgi:hypothetical protein